ncbi:MAG: Hpt domain-containing protein [Acidobacteriota bacterium]
MDSSKFLGKFKDATADHLQRMNELLLQLEQEPDRPEEVKELMREIHTLKGESRMMGFGDMADLSHAIEEVLKVQERGGFVNLAEVSDRLFDAFDLIERLMASKLDESEVDQDPEAFRRDLLRLAGQEDAVDPDNPDTTLVGAETPDLPDLPGQADLPDLSGFDPTPSAPLDLPGSSDIPDLSGFDPGASRSSPRPPAPEPPPVESAGTPDPNGPAQGGHSLDSTGPAPGSHSPDPNGPAQSGHSLDSTGPAPGVSKFLGKFRDATVDHLQRMNELLLLLEQDPARSEEVKELMREIHTLKGEARMMGFGDIAELSHALEDLLKAQQSEGFVRLEEVSDACFKTFDELQELLGSKLGEGPANVDIAGSCQQLRDLADRPAAAVAPPPTEPAPPPSPSAGGSSGGGATLDPGLSKFLSKFKDATEDHLERLNSLVLSLENQPDQPEAVKELMREIHTLKGESRMMGFGDMAELAHALEDLLRAQEIEGFQGLSGVADLILEALDGEATLLAGKLGTADGSFDVDELADRLRRAADGEAAPAPKPSTPSAPAPPAPTPPPASGPPVDPVLVEGFKDAAGEHASSLKSLVEGAEPERGEVHRALQSLGSEAALVGLEDLDTLATEMVIALQAEGPARVVPALKVLSDVLVAAVGQRAAGRSADDSWDRVRSALTEPEPEPEPEPKAEQAPPALPSAPPTPPEDSAPKSPPPRESAPPAPVAPTAPEEPPKPESKPASKPTSKPAAARAPKIEQTIRIGLAKLEELGNLTGDVYLNHTRAEDRQRRLAVLGEVAARQSRVVAILRQALSRAQVDEEDEILGSHEELVEANRALKRQIQDLLRADRDEYLRAGQLIVNLRERVRALQMLPVSTLFDMYPRMVRDIAKELSKKVRMVVDGEHTELDRKVLDAIRDPMVHLIRNAIDHGIEQPERREREGKTPVGTLRLAARAEGDHVVIEIEDDGGGIDPIRIKTGAVKKELITEAEASALSDEQAMQLIFAPGFSSKEEVTGLSGRGVGMDVVRDKVESLDGRIAVWSEPGHGTRMALRLPLTLAMARVLLLRAGGLLLAVPSTSVAEVLKVEEQEVRHVEAYEAIEWHDRTIPIVSLAHVLEHESLVGDGRRTVVVLSFEEHVVGFVVDGMEGEREVVVKRLDEFLGRVPNVAGATILSSGEIVVVLHVPQLIAATMGVSPVSLRARLKEQVAPEPQSAGPKRLLVVDDSIIVRDMMKGVLESAGFDVTLAVDGMDGLEKQLAGNYDLVITDVEMPRMDGFELTQSIKQSERHRRVPIIIVTTLDSPEAKARGLKAGAAAYVVKNLLNLSELIGTIERLVA